MEFYEHGGNIYGNDITYDFSVNSNPFGMPPGLKKTLREQIDRCEVYPDRHCLSLRREIARQMQIEDSQCICGSGASEIIHLLVRAVKPKRALLLAPAFSEYERALAAAECEINFYFLKEEKEFALEESYIAELQDEIDMVFLCNPNNPVGNIIPKELLRKIADSCRKHHIMLVIDECFLPFTREYEEVSGLFLLKEYRNLFLIHAFTKLYAIPGLRLGYGISSNEEMIKKMEKLSPSWHVSAMAQIAGLEALQEKEYVRSSREYLWRQQTVCCAAIRGMGGRVYEPKANYLFFKGPFGLYEALLKKKILIRSCENYRGLDGAFYRISIKKEEENRLLFRELKEVWDGKEYNDTGNDV